MSSTVEAILSQHQAALAALCQRFGVSRLDLFGSATTDAFDPLTSDLDFLVEFDTEAQQKAFDNYFGLRDQLETLFGRPVDLVTKGSLRNPYFIRDIEQSRRLIYASHT